MTPPLIVSRPEGLYCPEGEFFIDPWRPVDRAVITHAHSDHARRGNAHYLAHRDSAELLRIRLGADISLQTLEYGEAIEHKGVRISLHPAGHVLGSAQVRLECKGRVWVASGDYKLADDGTCRPFEPVRCDTFITESTFGLPIYRWPHQADLFADINNWWQRNAASGRASILFCYAFGKAQRILRGVDSAIGPIVCHGAVEPLNAVYRAAGVPLPDTFRVTDEAMNKSALSQALVLAPPSAAGNALAQALWRLFRCICQWLDAAARCAPPARGGSRLCHERPCRLASPASRYRQYPGRAGFRDARQHRHHGPLPARAGPRRASLCHGIRRRRRGRSRQY